ncbi:MAG: hypothetical protein ACXADC_13645 [Candidatus Thorarchaeota archaeon]
MSMSKRVGVGLLSIIFLVALVSAMPVDAKNFSKYRWWSESYYTWDPEWTGDVWTHEGLHGIFVWDNDNGAYRFLGPDGNSVQKFSGVWSVDFGGDGVIDIQGTHKGSFTYALNQYTINGQITYTSAEWSHLDGRKVHTVGNVDWDSLTSNTWFQIN